MSKLLSTKTTTVGSFIGWESHKTVFSFQNAQKLHSICNNIQTIVVEISFYQLLVCAVATAIDLIALETNDILSEYGLSSIDDLIVVLSMAFYFFYLSKALTSDLYEAYAKVNWGRFLAITGPIRPLSMIFSCGFLRKCKYTMGKNRLLLFYWYSGEYWKISLNKELLDLTVELIAASNCWLCMN